MTRPGGNITGSSALGAELHSKALQLLKEALPNIGPHRDPLGPDRAGRREQAEEARRAAQALGLHAVLTEVRAPTGLENAFVLHPSQLTYAQRTRIADLAARRRLPAFGMVRWLPEAGGLMSYSGNDSDRLRRAARYVDRIFRGARPAELPVEQPTRFEFVIKRG